MEIVKFSIDILTGVLAGANYGKNVPNWDSGEAEANLGQTFVAIDPGCFAPPAEKQGVNDGGDIINSNMLHQTNIKHQKTYRRKLNGRIVPMSKQKMYVN